MINDISAKGKSKMRKSNVNVSYNSWIIGLNGRKPGKR